MDIGIFSSSGKCIGYMPKDSPIPRAGEFITMKARRVDGRMRKGFRYIVKCLEYTVSPNGYDASEDDHVFVCITVERAAERVK